MVLLSKQPLTSLSFCILLRSALAAHCLIHLLTALLSLSLFSYKGQVIKPGSGNETGNEMGNEMTNNNSDSSIMNMGMIIWVSRFSGMGMVEWNTGMVDYWTTGTMEYWNDD